MIPFGIKIDAELLEYHERIKSLRTDMHNKLDDINSGTYTVKNDILQIIYDLKKILSIMKEAIISYYIPADKKQDYIDGLISVMEYFDEDGLIEYYTDLIKIELFTNVVEVNVKTLAAYATVSVNGLTLTDPSSAGMLREEDFINQGSDSPTREIRYTYIYHTLVSGDTLRSLAQRYLRNPSYAIDIARANDIRPTDILSGLVGEKIKIPVPAGSVITNSNRVFEYLPESRDNDTIERYLYGRDIKLINKKIILSGNNPSTISGKQVVKQNLLNKFRAKKIGLTPSEPNWGIGNIESDDNIPYLVKLERYLSRAEGQCIMDSRITDAFVKRDSININGEVIKYETKIRLYAGDTLEVNQ